MNIAAIHASGTQLVLEFAGAGSLALHWLHSVPGSSRTILEATDRYSAASMEALLGYLPEKFVDPGNAAAMAERAYLRACRLGDASRPRQGVACTATISTDRLKRGLHRACMAVRDHQSVTTLDLLLAKGERTREAEEELISRLLVDFIAEAASAGKRPLPALMKGERLRRRRRRRDDPLDALLAGAIRWVVVAPNGDRQADRKVRGVIYSGSFNPLHFGHEAMAAAATAATTLPVTFELAEINAEKSPLDRRELERRLAQFRHDRVVVTRSPLFVDKARDFPGCIFLVGYDTAARLVNIRFYGDKKIARDAALSQILAAHCRILVAGRLDQDSFKTLDDLSIPRGFEDLFIKLPDFRADVSATELRELRQSQ